jgi:hypothetical protein
MMPDEMRTTTKPERREITRRLFERDIEPVIRYCARNRGTIKAIHELYQRKLGQPINRDSVDRWLNPHRSRRTQPLYGAGKLLLLVARRVIEEQNRK